jgi:hypothetical protein
MESLQTNAVAAIQDVLGASTLERRTAAAEEQPAHAARGEHRLHVRIAQPAARPEVAARHHAAGTSSA